MHVAPSDPVNVLALARSEITLAQAIWGRRMAVNWFEGGRRIRDLLLWAVALSGGVYVIWGSTPSIYFSTAYPDDPWKVAGDDCPDPNESMYLWRYSFKPGDSRSVQLCFRVNERDQIPYQKTEPPKDAPPPVITMISPTRAETAVEEWYFEGSTFDDSVQDYMHARKDAFRMTPALEHAARDGLGKLAWNAGVQRFKDAAPWAGGIALVIWVITGLLGWIVRGFVGIPAGADFRPAKRE